LKGSTPKRVHSIPSDIEVYQNEAASCPKLASHGDDSDRAPCRQADDRNWIGGLYPSTGTGLPERSFQTVGRDGLRVQETSEAP
jgi:hypothetical protein